MAEKNQVHILFDCLPSNALKFANQDTIPTVQILTSETDEHWILEIPNGIGIDEKHYEMVFEVFRRAVDGNSYSGAGVGLTIARKIVERHGGVISLEQNTAGGAKVTFLIANDLHDYLAYPVCT